MREFLAYLVLRGAFSVVDRISFESSSRFASALAWIWWVIDRRGRRIAIENILATGIEVERGRARALSRRSMQHFGVLAVESLKSEFFLAEDRWRDHVRLAIAPDVMAVLEDPEQTLIMVSGHLGNWEIAAQFLSRYKPVAGITRTNPNPQLERLVSARKGRQRFRAIPRYAADATRLMAILERREILAILTDVHARSGGILVDFFGRPAATYTTPAMLHLVTRTPICFGTCLRVAPRRFEMRTSPLIRHLPSGDRRADVRAILATINGYLETEIRRAPEQYIWNYRRWRPIQSAGSAVSEARAGG